MRAGFWRKCGVCFRWCRVSLLLLILAVLCVLLWFNQVGLPGFLKEPLLTNLKERGIQVEFSRMRLRMTRGIVAENVRVVAADNPASPALSLGEVQLLLDFGGLLRGHLQVEGLVLREGRLVVPIAGNTQTPNTLELTNIQTDLRFKTSDTWSLDNFQADFNGAKLALSGDLSHASDLGKWEIFRAKKTSVPADWQTRLRNLSEVLAKIHLAGTPNLALNIEGDAREPHSFAIRLQVLAPAANTPWFSAKKFQFIANLTAPANLPANLVVSGFWSNLQPYRLAWSASFSQLKSAEINARNVTASGLWRAPELAMDIRLQDAAQTAPGSAFTAQDLQFTARLTTTSGGPANQFAPGILSNLQPYRLTWYAHVSQLKSDKLDVATVVANGDWRTPELTVDLRLQDAAQTARPPGFSVEGFQFNAQLTALPNNPAGQPLPGIWSRLQPWQLAWSARLTQLKSEPLSITAMAATGDWRAPKLAVTNLSVSLGNGWSQGGLQFDAASQCLSFTNASAFDPQAIEALLPEITRERLALCTWTEPPALRLTGTADFSSWLNPAEARENRALPVTVQGEFAVTNPAVAGFLLDQVQSHVSYSNQVWQLPDLQVIREKTRLQFNGGEDENTKLFGVQIQGAFDVNQIRPLLKSKAAVREVGRLTFHEPLMLDLTVSGRMHDPDSLAVAGHLALTNFAARGGTADSLTTDIRYTNRIIDFFHVFSRRNQGAEILAADQITLNLSQHRLSFTNGFSTAQPQVVADSIGPKTGRTLEPYQFLEPPTARVNGYVSLASSEDSQEPEEADLQVDVLKGAAFRWERFNSRRVAGTLHWFGGTLLLTNIDAEFYGGNATGTALFDFRPRAGTDFSFCMDATNANLHRLVADFASPTNKLEGLVSGHFVVTSGNSTNWQFMSGYGNASLHDGLLWDAPMFGVLTPAMNAISPGLGSSRATDAAARFTMTKGVIYSDSLEIHSSLMLRLRYAGTVDLQENLNARATIEPLRDTWGLGPIIGAVSWPFSKLFEYKVTGTLSDPKMAPLNLVSKLLLTPLTVPLHPVKTIKGILPANNSTNAPPAK